MSDVPENILEEQPGRRQGACIMKGTFQLIRHDDHVELELNFDDQSKVVLLHPTPDGQHWGDIWWVIERRDPLPLEEAV